jgi:non-ribosomal peptide synthetase component F/acyl carrier protein
MIPFAFVMLEKLPLTPNGKVDRQALPSPGSGRPDLRIPFAPPRNRTEEELTKIWADVLGLNEVGIHDPFLELGGDSLRASQLISRVLNLFSLELSMQILLDAPTIADMAEVIAIHQDKGINGSNGKFAIMEHSIPLRKTSGPSSLSFSQERLWFLSQFDEIGSAYNLRDAYRLKGPLNRNALEKALQATVDRHEILRTTYQFVDDKPIQEVHPDRRIKLDDVDLRGNLGGQSEKKIRELLRIEIQRLFDLSQDLMLRATLFRLKDEEHVLLLVIHLIASDGWSMDVLHQDISEFYAAYAEGRSFNLPGLPIQYSDFAEWQRNRLQGEIFEQQILYWKEQLAGSPSLLPLPTDRPRPARQTYQGAHEKFCLPPDLLIALKDLSLKEQATLFMTLLSGFKTLLHRHTSSEDIAVGSPIAGRTRMETEKLIGFFLNTLVLRTDLSGNPTFRQLMKRVRKVALGAYAHQDLPFEKLVAELQPDRNPSHSPLFQIMFVLQDGHSKELTLSGLQTQKIHPGRETSKFDLTLSLHERGDVIEGHLEYNTDLFARKTIRRMVGHFQTLLEEMVKDPDQKISYIPLMSGQERHRLLVEWNNTQAYYPAACIHELFEAQAEKTPDTVALFFEEDQMTYRELNDRSNQVANHLRGLGVKTGTSVAIYVERSLEMVVGLLGILKAGGAYVPLDPSYPNERLAYMVEDSKAAILVTKENLKAELPKSEVRVVYLDSDWEKISNESKENPIRWTEPDDLAYVIYTSGSTGKPKGVMGIHRGAVNRFAWMWETYPFKSGEVVCQKTALSFVDSVWEIFGPLLQGIPSWIIPDHVVKEPIQLGKFLAKGNINRIVLVPSFLRALFDSTLNLKKELPNLKLFMVHPKFLPTPLITSLKKTNRFQAFLSASPLQIISSTFSTGTSSPFQLPFRVSFILEARAWLGVI